MHLAILSPLSLFSLILWTTTLAAPLVAPAPGLMSVLARRNNPFKINDTEAAIYEWNQGVKLASGYGAIADRSHMKQQKANDTLAGLEGRHGIFTALKRGVVKGYRKYHGSKARDYTDLHQMKLKELNVTAADMPRLLQFCQKMWYNNPRYSPEELSKAGCGWQNMYESGFSGGVW